MARQPLPPVAVVIGFVDRINRTDLEGLGAMMTEDHTLTVLDEAPIEGREANVEAWRGYFDGFPSYVIYPRQVASSGETVAVFGSTTGSHLGLPDDEELLLDVAWLAEVVDGQLRSWRVVEDAPDLRAAFGIDPAP